VVRQAVDAPADRQVRILATSELLRLGAHREIDYLKTHLPEEDA